MANRSKEDPIWDTKVEMIGMVVGVTIQGETIWKGRIIEDSNWNNQCHPWYTKWRKTKNEKKVELRDQWEEQP